MVVGQHQILNWTPHKRHKKEKQCARQKKLALMNNIVKKEKRTNV